MLDSVGWQNVHESGLLLSAHFKIVTNAWKGSGGSLRTIFERYLYLDNLEAFLTTPELII